MEVTQLGIESLFLNISIRQLNKKGLDQSGAPYHTTSEKIVHCKPNLNKRGCMSNHPCVDKPSVSQ